MEGVQDAVMWRRTGQEEHDRLEGIEEQAHRLANNPAERHDERDDEQRDLLCTAPNKRMSACHFRRNNETVLGGRHVRYSSRRQRRARG